LDRRARKKKLEDESYSSLDKATNTIFLVGDITLRQASQFRQQLRTLERLKKCPAVLVEINSLGGDVEAGFMIIDSIMLSKKPVTTRVTGVAMSMAALILAAGEVRESLPSATIMLHEGSHWFGGAYHQIETELGEANRLEKLCNDYLDRRTGKEPGYWVQKCGPNNLYLTAEQALAEGLLTAIVKRG
jgi:ATP-dependent Clp protease protease subunit